MTIRSREQPGENEILPVERPHVLFTPIPDRGAGRYQLRTSELAVRQTTGVVDP